MATIETVLGPIDAETLGFTLSHEHVVGGGAQERWYYPWRFDWERTRERASAQLRTVKAEGVDAIIDLTTPDLGRNVAMLAENARATGVHVIAATGMWRDVPRVFATRDIDESAAIFIREIEVGVDDTGIKAGAIKVANDEEGISEAHERVLRAAARASIRTGCPISTHHWARGEQGREQLRIFQEEGLPAHQICIGHSADTTDADYLEALLREGAYLSMDRYPGRPGRPNWQERNATVKELVDRGWANRLMLGHDASASRAVPAGDAEPPSDGYNPDGLLFLTRTGIPALLEAGVAQEAVDEMTREVPRRFLSGES
jgi:phosphotriesterase-related protein